MFPLSRKVERSGPFAAGLGAAVIYGAVMALLSDALGKPAASRPPTEGHWLALASVFICGLFSISSSRRNRRTVAVMEGTGVMRFADRTGYRKDIVDYVDQERSMGVCLLLYSFVVAAWAVTAGTVLLPMEAGILGAVVWMGLTGYRNSTLTQRLVERLTEEVRG